MYMYYSITAWQESRSHYVQMVKIKRTYKHTTPPTPEEGIERLLTLVCFTS